MSDEFVRYIVKCVMDFTDGNCEPKQASRGDMLDLNADQWRKLGKSAPEAFELVDRRIPNPKKKKSAPKKAALLHDKSKN